MTAAESPAWIERPGRRVAYATYGTADGAPVVYCHGAPGSRIEGRLLDDAARAAGVRLFVPDRPGAGASPNRAGRTIGDWTGAFDALLAEHSLDDVGLVGFSGGGPYALTCAAARPDAVSGVGLLASAAPPAAPDDDLALPTRLASEVARLSPRATAWLLGLQTRLAVHRPPSFAARIYTDRPVGADGVDSTVAATLQANVATALEGGARGVARDLHLLATDWDVDLGDVDVPVSARYGEQDANAPPSHGAFLVDRLPDASLTVRSDADHLAVLLRAGPAVLRAVAPRFEEPG